MSSVATRKCVQHPAREAVARCPSCGEHFCRECVVEHNGVLLCAACLAKEAVAVEPARLTWLRIRELLLTTTCVLVVWVAFYSLGSLLKAIPAKVHEGTVWQSPHAP